MLRRTPVALLHDLTDVASETNPQAGTNQNPPELGMERDKELIASARRWRLILNLLRGSYFYH